MSVSARVAEPKAPPRVRPAAARAKAATRRRLIAAGKRLFAREGLHRVTTHDIARAAGVAPGTFYLHFADKTALFREIANTTFDELRARLEQVSAAYDNARDGVRGRVEALVDFAEENRDLIRIIFGSDTEAAAVETELLDEFAARIARGRSELVAKGQMPANLEPAVLSQALVGMLSRVVRWWVDDPSRATRAAVIETLTSIQLAGTHPAKPKE